MKKMKANFSKKQHLRQKPLRGGGQRLWRAGVVAQGAQGQSDPLPAGDAAMNFNFASGGAGLLVDLRPGIGQDYLDYARRPGWRPTPAFQGHGHVSGDMLLTTPKEKYAGDGGRKGHAKRRQKYIPPIALSFKS